jgi:hypothetical protein
MVVVEAAEVEAKPEVQTVLVKAAMVLTGNR